MCSRIMRDPLARKSAAEYLGNFIADKTDGGFTRGTQWLVWKFESDSTLQIASSVSFSYIPLCIGCSNTICNAYVRKGSPLTVTCTACQ